MDTTTLTIIGIIATLATFGGVYWKTTSARKEKEKHAHKDIVTALARVLAQGQDSLDLPLVESLIKSKARAYDVTLSSIDELPKVAEDLVAKFTESEFITPEIRHKLIEKVLLLQEKFERKEPRLEAAVAEYQQVSRPDRYRRNILLSAIAALAAGTVFLATAYGVDFFKPGVPEDSSFYLTYALIISVMSVTASLLYLREKRRSKAKEAKDSLYLSKMFERIVTEAINELAPKASVERNVKIVQGGYYAEADLVIKVNDETLPIEIKAGSIRQEAIGTIVEAMKLLKSRRSILITSSQVQERIKKMALEHNILLLEGITTKEDLIRGLRDIKLFR